jgi:putative ABC transport system permease protein
VQLRKLVWREMFERKSQLATSFVAILLGIAVVVSIKNITFYSEKAVARELDALGANILVLPKSASVQDYYSADMQDGDIPEEYVTTLTLSDLQGLDNLSPKLSAAVEIRGRRFTLTGILPKSEFQAKAAWQGAGIFARPLEGCGPAGRLRRRGGRPRRVQAAGTGNTRPATRGGRPGAGRGPDRFRRRRSARREGR